LIRCRFAITTYASIRSDGLLNGSPRGKDANSRTILTWIAQGLGQAGPPIVDLAPDPTRAEHLEAFLDADEVVFAFPLYTDSMPGLVKAFLESVALVDKATRLTYSVNRLRRPGSAEASGQVATPPPMARYELAY
jgi:hypothetical protein